MTWLALAVLVAIQVAAGAAWWSWIRPRSSLLEVLGMGAALGTAISMLAGLVALLLPVPPGSRPWFTLAPAAVTLVWWVTRHRRITLHRSSAAEWWALVIALVSGGTALVVNASHYPLRWSGSTSAFHPDMLFFEALANGMPTAGPTDSILMSDSDLRYHWFTYAWAGQLTSLTDAAPFVTLTRVLPIIALVGLAMVAASWAWRATRIAWVPTLAVLLLVTGGYVGATYGTILNFDSPSQALSALWLTAWVVVALRWLTRPSWPVAVLLSLLAIALTGGKASAGVVAALATVVLLIVSVVRAGSISRVRALWLAVMTCVPAGIVYLLLLSGSAEQGGLKLFAILDRASSVQGLNPVNTPRGIAVGTLILLLAMMPRWAGMAWLMASRSTRWQPATVLGAGLLVASVGSLLAVSGGLNDTWFALSASAPLAVLSAIGVGRAVRHVSRPTAGLIPPLVWLGLICGIAAAVVVTVVWSTGSAPDGWRWAGPPVGACLAALLALALMRLPELQGRRRVRWLAAVTVVFIMMAVPSRFLGLAADTLAPPTEQRLGTDAFTPFTPFVPSIDQGLVVSLTSDQADAAALLRAQGSAPGLIATNVSFSPLVAALTGTPTWVSGIKYQAPYGTPDAVDDLLAREAATHAFITSPTEETLRPLCEAGVAWVWVDPERTDVTDWEPQGRVAFTGEGVVLLMLDCAAGATALS